jgi:hypothetical protein
MAYVAFIHRGQVSANGQSAMTSQVDGFQRLSFVMSSVKIDITGGNMNLIAKNEVMKAIIATLMIE